MKKIENNKGITLIALVITIIVLLILAGVAISMLSGENGILKQAANSKLETEQASTDEVIKLAALAGLTAGNGKISGDKALQALNDGLDEAGYTGEDITKVPTTITIGNKDYGIETNGTIKEVVKIEKYIGKEITEGKVTLTDVNLDVIVVPEGFTIKSDSPSLINKGVVVVAPDESEFVWIPVEDINSMVMCQSRSVESDCNIVKGEDGELVCANHADTLICGKLYSNGNDFDSTVTTQTYKVNSNRREPDVLIETNYMNGGDFIAGNENYGFALLRSIIKLEGTDEEIKVKWKEQLQNEFEEMAKYVYENKGYYIGRYESSLNGTKLQSKKGEQAATCSKTSANRWYGMYQREKDYSKDNDITNVVGSSMIWGSQYDQMMLWMERSGVDITKTIGTKRNMGTGSDVGTTGTKSTDIINNIYDLYGNGYEQTLEASGDNARIARGGLFKSYADYAPSKRDYIMDYTTGSTWCSSRIALYVK